MIKIYIINLERSVERRMEIINKMDKYDLSYEIFNAVDGVNIDARIMQEIHHNTNLFKKLYKKEMDKREAGAALSHLALYENIVSEKIECAIIMEDDGDFDYRLKHLVENKQKLTRVLKSYDLVLLGYCRHDLDYKRKGVCSYWNRINVDKILRVGTPVYWYWSAIGYLITNIGAQKLLQQGKLPVMQADFLTANSPYYKVRLGLIREPIIWAGSLSIISTIRDENAPLVNNENATSQQSNFWDYLKSCKDIWSQLNSGKQIYTASKRKYSLVRRKLNLFLLKLSTKKYPFVIEMKKGLINR